ncbi:3-hydroxybutyrate dehydrogenase [Marinibactrum halimedae]|uniref:3-hydroxybutyrate dehydrogenase n=1 Tax=Marinibactrum halimedae TaxID=1444977 RepID=A0AA37T9Y0_9GAMM|nr:3-hydroxybutyrate dehydrogenase [Marinibactrum halimedae]MCD9459395.1 3-hydroxybutyrate dehydrogenase [Marinibactrum halimedae]GLS27538.1 3-hydroxybutyrate dehydrogenase [Marinibactrum halimedae]
MTLQKGSSTAVSDSDSESKSQNSTVLVTGAASGIGLSISESLAASGHRVIVSDMNEDAALSAVEHIRSQGGSAEAFVLNVTSQDNIDAVCEQFPHIDVLINNAGIQHVSKLEDFPADRWKLLIDVLLTGPAMLTRAVLPGMKARNYGRIINIGSIHALVASPYKSAYVAAKHGLIGFAKTVALELGEHDITINTLCPAYVKTPLVEKQIADQARENGISEDAVINDIMLAPMAKKSFIALEELCGSIDFFLSPAARNMTAQTIVLDGGWTAR